MATSDWLSIDEIARLWGEETGRDTARFKTDLEDWFARFVKQPTTARTQSLISGAADDKTNRLMGMLGARYLERSTFEAFCQERGYETPRFWFARRTATTGGVGSRAAGTTPPPSEPARTGPDEARADGGGKAHSDLAAFQSQIANLRHRLDSPKTDFPGFSGPAASDDRVPEPDPEPDAGRPSAAARRRELSERALAAATDPVGSTDSDDTKAKLAEAERRIAELTAAAWPGNASSAAPSAAPSGPAEPDLAAEERTQLRDAAPPSFASYRDPSVTRQLLRTSSARRKRRLRIALTAGLVVGFVALSIFGIDTAVELARKHQAPIAAETATPPTGLGHTAGQALATQAREPAGGTLPGDGSATASRTPAAAETPGGAGGLAAARQQIAVLTQAAEESDKLVARLQDELAIARQTAEMARQAAPSAAAGWTADEQLAFQALSAEVAMARRELEQTRQSAARADSDAAPAAGETAELAAMRESLEANRQQTTELSAALERANGEVDSLQAALDQAKAEASEAKGARETTATAASEVGSALSDAEAKIESLDAQLQAAFNSVAEANKNAAEARSQSLSLQTEITRLKNELATASSEGAELRAALERTEAKAEASQQEPALAAGAAAAHAAALQRELAAARQRIDELNRAVPSAEATGAAPDGTSPGDQTAGADAPAATDASPAPEIEETLTAVEVSADAASSAAAPTEVPAPPAEPATAVGPVAAVEPAAAQSAASVDRVTADELLNDPAKLVGREVEVTGSVVWLLWRYRLQTERSADSLVIDVEGLRPQERDSLKQAVDAAGFLGGVQARVRGRIDRDGASNYRLTAAEVAIIE